MDNFALKSRLFDAANRLDGIADQMSGPETARDLPVIADGVRQAAEEYYTRLEDRQAEKPRDNDEGEVSE